jgi:hypothetical protein
MYKFALAIKVIFGLFNSALPAPEIWAEPVPYFLDKQIGNYIAPLSERGPGHRGLDVLVGNESIRAPKAGFVAFNGLVIDRRVVTIRSGDYRISFEPVCSDLAVGQAIDQGEPVGYLCEGEAGYQEHCEGCVHLSVRVDRGYLNPMLFYGSLMPSKIVS